MKYFRAALVVFASVFSLARLAHAQDEDQSRRTPPVEIPDFSNLDEYIYEPKSIVTLGFRHLSGAKTKFSGTGRIPSPEDPGPATGANIQRIYHDGLVNPDTRTIGRVDSSGDPVKDPDANTQIFDPITPDGKTNSWSYSNNSQRDPGVASDAIAGYMAFHTYSADILGSTKTGAADAVSTNGMEIAVSRDMGKLFGTRITWDLMAGMSLNDISSSQAGAVTAKITTTTDYYSTFGQTPPDAPYSAPSSTAQTITDANGNAILNSDGSTQTVSVDTTVLLGNEPVKRTKSESTNTTSVTGRWKVKGAYYTFRAGPVIWIPITSRFRASLSLGPALVYAGTVYGVTESFIPLDGATEITATAASETSKVLWGYYADASLQFDLTDRTGFYAGAVYQTAGNYDQKIQAENANFSTNIDLSNQSGLRAGMTIRF